MVVIAVGHAIRRKLKSILPNDIDLLLFRKLRKDMLPEQSDDIFVPFDNSQRFHFRFFRNHNTPFRVRKQQPAPLPWLWVAAWFLFHSV